MRLRQRGFVLTGWMYLVGALAALGLIYLITQGVTRYLNGIRTEAQKAGQDECNAAYTTRDNKALTKTLARVVELETAARKLEREHVDELARVTSKLKKEKANEKARADRFDADLAAGRLVVRGDAFQTGGCPANSDRVETGSAGPSPGGSDGVAACQLSAKARSDLLEVGNDANETARLLAACQLIVIEDRRVCGVN